MSPRLMVVPLPRTCGPPFLTIDSAPPGFEERSFRRSFSRLPPSEASRPWTPNLTVISTGVPKTALQSKLPRAVVSEQIAVPNIPANHLNRAVSGLVHDAPFRRTRNGRAGGVPGPERVPSILGSVQTGAVHQFLHHPSHVDYRTAGLKPWRKTAASATCGTRDCVRHKALGLWRCGD